MKKLLLLLLLLPILSFGQNSTPATVIINLDQYMSETSWDIQDTAGNVVASDGPYYSAVNYQSLTIPVVIPAGPMVFTIYDSYGDGLNGALWGGLDGSYYVVQCNDTLVYGDDPAFGNDSMHFFVSDACPPVMGCLDPAFVEFNPLANLSDGSCNTLKIFGCTDDSMFNYDSAANTMALIPNCDYVLTLTDLIGDGWQASYLEVKQDTNTWYYTIDTALYTQDFIINLNSPMQVEFTFHITQQAALTASHCGFKLTNPLGDVTIEVLAPFIQPLFKYKTSTYCGNLCIEKIFGCTYSTAINYDSLANTDDVSCYYNPGCTSPTYIEYNASYDYDDGSCNTLVVLGCMDSLAFNYNALANTEITGSCILVVTGCMQPLAFNYNPNANVSDTCIAVVYGCMNAVALNYNPLANIDDDGCIGIVYGCIDTSAFNYDPTANVNDSSCIPFIYGCINPSQFNYNPLANTNNGTCIPFIFGCTDSVMFNYNPLANADNSSCVPFVFGCTDPSMLNYDPLSNAEDFSCIEFVYGCMDEEAFNYDPTANTENNSCVTIIKGCMDPNAYNYSVEANVSDNCNYDAVCITGPGEPYWLNDPCYAWVISVDDYCCNNEWDDVCQATYNYCEGSWVGDVPARISVENALMIYPNPTINTININKNVDINVLNYVGGVVMSKTNTNILDVSKISPGIYMLQITYNNKTINKRIIKK